MHTFSAKVHKIDINPYVQVPDAILQNLQQDANKEKGPIPVRGTLEGKPFIANVEVGDRVRIQIQFDGAPGTVAAPRELTFALSKDKQAKEAFEKLAPSRQKEILRYLHSLKQPATLERKIEKVIQILKGEPVEGLVAVRRVKR